MDLKQIQQKTIEIQKTFPIQFDKRDLIIDLTEEVGELAQAMLIVEKRKYSNNPSKQKTKADIANALSDILFDLLVLAQEYELDMDTEYVIVLEEMRGRIKRGNLKELIYDSRFTIYE
jgi:NTP pyrophosphatase (non-canonical NTP hydrolase)